MPTPQSTEPRKRYTADQVNKVLSSGSVVVLGDDIETFQSNLDQVLGKIK